MGRDDHPASWSSICLYSSKHTTCPLQSRQGAGCQRKNSPGGTEGQPGVRGAGQRENGPGTSWETHRAEQTDGNEETLTAV